MCGNASCCQIHRVTEGHLREPAVSHGRVLVSLQHNNDTNQRTFANHTVVACVCVCMCGNYSAGFSNVGMVILGFSSLLSEEDRQKADGQWFKSSYSEGFAGESGVCRVGVGVGAASTFELHILSNVFLASAGLCSL